MAGSGRVFLRCCSSCCTLSPRRSTTMQDNRRPALLQSSTPLLLLSPAPVLLMPPLLLLALAPLLPFQLLVQPTAVLLTVPPGDTCSNVSRSCTKRYGVPVDALNSVLAPAAVSSAAVPAAAGAAEAGVLPVQAVLPPSTPGAAGATSMRKTASSLLARAAWLRRVVSTNCLDTGVR